MFSKHDPGSASTPELSVYALNPGPDYTHDLELYDGVPASRADRASPPHSQGCRNIRNGLSGSAKAYDHHRIVLPHPGDPLTLYKDALRAIRLARDMSTEHVLHSRHSNTVHISPSSEERWSICRGTSSNIVVLRNWDYNSFVFFSLDRPYMRAEFTLATDRVRVKWTVGFTDPHLLLGCKYFDSEFAISSTEDSPYGVLELQVQVHEFSISPNAFGCPRKQWATLNLEGLRAGSGTVLAFSTFIRLRDPYVFIFTRRHKRPVMLFNWRTSTYWSFWLRCEDSEPHEKIDIQEATFHPFRDSILVEDVEYTCYPFGRPKSLFQLDIPSILAVADSGSTGIVREVSVTKIVNFDPSSGFQATATAHSTPLQISGVSSWSLNYLHMPDPTLFIEGSLSDSNSQPVLLSVCFTEDETEATVLTTRIPIPDDLSHRHHHYLAPSRLYSVYSPTSESTSTYSHFIFHNGPGEPSTSRWVELKVPPEETELFNQTESGKMALARRSNQRFPSIAFDPSHGRLLEILDDILFVVQY
ncbi:hypothetical protein SISNIDRAFT_498366 [Sistotremastrum niveocremeum HHB9708]|uniref:Uncharacterized protein n=1 Tax=Sistotremastrum niveocremeum HHB9708 TaxID=1314777 RepID=A0A164NET8_9AGAM|nr:hypothetical protein SISNIDRAFT_498366 [Sistotremastrum niveocremeum HHB9708]